MTCSRVRTNRKLQAEAVRTCESDVVRGGAASLSGGAAKQAKCHSKHRCKFLHVEE